MIHLYCNRTTVCVCSHKPIIHFIRYMHNSLTSYVCFGGTINTYSQPACIEMFVCVGDLYLYAKTINDGIKITEIQSNNVIDFKALHSNPVMDNGYVLHITYHSTFICLLIYLLCHLKL